MLCMKKKYGNIDLPLKNYNVTFQCWVFKIYKNFLTSHASNSAFERLITLSKHVFNKVTFQSLLDLLLPATPDIVPVAI